MCIVIYEVLQGSGAPGHACVASFLSFVLLIFEIMHKHLGEILLNYRTESQILVGCEYRRG